MYTAKAGLNRLGLFRSGFQLPYLYQIYLLIADPLRCIAVKFQSKTLIPPHKNQNFQKFFIFFPHNDLAQIPRSEKGRFSHQTRRYIQL